MKKLKVWFFINKKTGNPEPLEWKNWEDGYGIFGTKKALMENAYKEVPKGYKAIKKNIKL